MKNALLALTSAGLLLSIILPAARNEPASTPAARSTAALLHGEAVLQTSPFGVSLWVQSFAATTTKVDTYLTVPWETVTLKAFGNRVYVRLGTDGDTTSWASRIFWPIEDGEGLKLDPQTRLRRFEYYSDATATLYLAGTKRSPQW